ncbi:MAG: SDR family NAD(P)-dependent oxidoreductase [Nitrospirae bacterium]|nr:SDR family NAD(P)-dependent oxidoreductase [Nitrospirota bacterium]
MDTVLVTGCAGFIAYKTSSLLLAQGKKVIGIDNMNDYYDVKVKHWRLAQLKEMKGFTFILGDISDYSNMDKVFASNKIDAVINLAARAGVRASVADPWIYLETNTKGTLNLLECCKKYNVKKFVLSSTSSLYAFNKMPFVETANTDATLAPYSATKKAAEAFCYTYHYLSGIDISIPRYFTVYGPAGRPDMSIFKFIKNIDRNLPIPVFGDGKQTRDFTYIDDIASGTILSLKNCGYEIFNLGNDNCTVLMDVINMIEDQLGKKAVIDWQPLHPADVTATWADISKAKRLFGWTPTIKIEEGLKNTVEWYLKNKEFVMGLRDSE